MRSLRAAQTLASRSLLLSARALHGAAASPAATAAGGSRWGNNPPPPAPAPSSSRALQGGIAGAVSFSLTFATVAAAEVQAKERLPADLLPQNVVLYQYQACPFCNKVRGETNSDHAFSIRVCSSFGNDSPVILPPFQIQSEIVWP
jgi:microsomal prostaglandin-E synthase 2